MPLRLRQLSPLEPFTYALASPSPPRTPGDNAQGASSSSHPISAVPRPPADFIPERDMHMFGARPLAEERGKGLVKCKRCGKVVLEWAAAEHRRICNHVLDGIPLKKSLKADKSIKKSETLKRRASDASDDLTSPTQIKRSRLDSELLSLDPAVYKGMGLKKSEIKRLKKEKERLEKREAKEKERMEVAERKRMRANGPIDLDRQCGVINDKNLPCSRSLTCKTHTVGAKRAVQGRTRPYDSLYLEWQRINNPNFKEPSKPLRRDKDGLPIGQGGGSGSGNGAGHDGSGGMSDKSKNKGMGLGADGKSLSGKKRWIGGVGSGFPSSMKAGAGDEGIQDGEEGQRELEDLIACTKLAGERVRAAIGMLGMSWTASAGTAAQPATGGSAAQAQAQTARKQSKSQAAGSALPSNTQPPAAKESISNPNSNPIPAAGSNGKTVPAPTPASAALPASASASTPITNHNTTRTGTIPFSSTTVWRTASNVNFLGVGETLTKALATRMGNVMMPHHGHGHGHGHSHPGLINVNSHSGSKGVKVRPGQNQGSGQGQAQGQGMKIQMPSAMVSGTGMGDGLAGVGVGAGGGGGGGGGGQALYPVVVS